MGKNFNAVTVVGLGVIGGSYAKALSRLGYTVYGVDRDEDSVRAARACGAIVDGAAQPDGFFGISDLIVMALYPTQIKDYIANHIDKIKGGSVICDVAGLKSHFTDEIEAVLPDDVQFVFCHPMAGREKRGFAYADERVFRGANFIVTPTARTDRGAIVRVCDTAREMGFGRIVEVSPTEHDGIVAFTSQLPHALAVALINSDADPDTTGAFIGDSYRDLTRIANINEQLWCELFMGNRINLIDKIDAFSAQLQRIRDAVAQNDAPALIDCFVSSSARRSKLDR